MASTVQRTNLELVSDMTKVYHKDFPVADKTLLIPTNARAYVDGEWVTRNTSGKLERAADISQANDTVAASLRPFPIWAESGRTDTQATSKGLLPCLYQGWYEAYTRIYKSAGITALEQPLKVAVVELTDKDGVTRKYSGLIVHAGVGDNDPVVGYVAELPSAKNQQRLKFYSGARTFG